MNVEKIYTNADRKNVAKYVIYAEIDNEKGVFKNNGYAYADPELTKKISSDELGDLFYTGLIVRGVATNSGTKEIQGPYMLVSGFLDGKLLGINYSTLLCICPGSTSCMSIGIYSSEYKPGEID